MRSAAVHRLSANEALLTKQNEKLTELTLAAEAGTLLDFKGLLVVVDQLLVRDLLHAVTPLEADVGGGFHVHIDTADTAFSDGVALVRLSGTARLNDSAVGSPVTVFGAIDVVELNATSGVLQCGISIVGVEAQDSEVLGRNDPVGRLTEALTHGGLSLLVGALEIPVKVEDQLSIPAVDSKRLKIAAESLPLKVGARQIKVFGGKLWIFVNVDLSRATPVAAPVAPTVGAKP